MLRVILLVCSGCCVTRALEPLTGVVPDDEELKVFPRTLRAALSKIAPSSKSSHIRPKDTTPNTNSSNLVIHIVGASDVEDAVDWENMCRDGFTLVLVGPMVSYQ